MKLNLKAIFLTAALVNLATFGYCLSQQVSQNISSKTAITVRQKALINIAKHVKADTCWKNNSKQVFKLGDVISLQGTDTGKIPTSCIYVPKTKQFLSVSYSSDELLVQHIFSIREVQFQKTVKVES
jgi:hypothetical protein